MEVHDRHTLVRFFSEMPEVETALVSELMVTLTVIHLDRDCSTPWFCWSQDHFSETWTRHWETRPVWREISQALALKSNLLQWNFSSNVDIFTTKKGSRFLHCWCLHFKRCLLRWWLLLCTFATQLVYICTCVTVSGRNRTWVFGLRLYYKLRVGLICASKMHQILVHPWCVCEHHL